MTKGRIAGDGRPGKEYEYILEEVEFIPFRHYMWRREIPDRYYWVVEAMGTDNRKGYTRPAKHHWAFMPGTFIYEEVVFVGYLDDVHKWVRCHPIGDESTILDILRDDIICTNWEFKNLPHIIKDGKIIGVTTDEVIPLSRPFFEEAS
jgi:hypothetical protein